MGREARLSDILRAWRGRCPLGQWAVNGVSSWQRRGMTRGAGEPSLSKSANTVARFSPLWRATCSDLCCRVEGTVRTATVGPCNPFGKTACRGTSRNGRCAACSRRRRTTTSRSRDVPVERLLPETAQRAVSPSVFSRSPKDFRKEAAGSRGSSFVQDSHPSAGVESTRLTVCSKQPDA